MTVSSNTHTELRRRSDGVVQTYHVGRSREGRFPTHPNTETEISLAPQLSAREARKQRKLEKQYLRSRAWAEKAVSHDHPELGGSERAALVNDYADEHYRNHTEFNWVQRQSTAAAYAAISTAGGAAVFAALEAGMRSGAIVTNEHHQFTAAQSDFVSWSVGAASAFFSFSAAYVVLHGRKERSNRSIRKANRA